MKGALRHLSSRSPNTLGTFPHNFSTEMNDTSPVKTKFGDLLVDSALCPESCTSIEHGVCSAFAADPLTPLCVCESGWSGDKCEVDCAGKVVGLYACFAVFHIIVLALACRKVRTHQTC